MIKYQFVFLELFSVNVALLISTTNSNLIRHFFPYIHKRQFDVEYGSLNMDAACPLMKSSFVFIKLDIFHISNVACFEIWGHPLHYQTAKTSAEVYCFQQSSIPLACYFTKNNSPPQVMLMFYDKVDGPNQQYTSHI